jgi:hypothetical protein
MEKFYVCCVYSHITQKFLSSSWSRLLWPNHTAASLLFATACAVLFCLAPSECLGQMQLFPTPVVAGTLGHKDSAAVAEVQAFVQATGGSSWVDLAATGTLTYPDGSAHSASIWLQSSQNARLDVSFDSGLRSTRLAGAFGAFQDETGEISPILPINSRAGIVAFPLLWSEALNSPQVSLYDHGIVPIGTTMLHMVTLEIPVTPGDAEPGNPTEATDFYFDPSTSLLLFSVQSLQFANSAGQAFQQVTAYSGYQGFGGVLVPTTIQQALNGQVEWNLALMQVLVNSTTDPNIFLFQDVTQ